MINSTFSKASRWQLLVLLLAATFLTGCANFYVDGQTREVEASHFKKSNSAQPVQVFFEFQTKGVANPRATEMLKSKVLDQLKASGIFSRIVDSGDQSTGTLSITLNNVPLTDDAFTKGFLTGFTFGLAGSQVTDGYVCTVRYRRAAGAEPIQKAARHAIHTTMGSAAAPSNANKAADINEAVLTMTRQIISNVLNDLTHDAAF